MKYLRGSFLIVIQCTFCRAVSGSQQAALASLCVCSDVPGGYFWTVCIHVCIFLQACHYFSKKKEKKISLQKHLTMQEMTKNASKYRQRDWIQPRQWVWFQSKCAHFVRISWKTLNPPDYCLGKKVLRSVKIRSHRCKLSFFDWHTWHLILLSTFAHMSGPNILPHHNFQSKKSIFKPSRWLMLRNHMIHQPPTPPYPAFVRR